MYRALAHKESFAIRPRKIKIQKNKTHNHQDTYYKKHFSEESPISVRWYRLVSSKNKRVGAKVRDRLAQNPDPVTEITVYEGPTNPENPSDTLREVFGGFRGPSESEIPQGGGKTWDFTLMNCRPLVMLLLENEVWMMQF